MTPTLPKTSLNTPKARPVAIIGSRALEHRQLSKTLQGEWLELWRDSPSMAILLSTTLLGAVRILGEELGVSEGSLVRKPTL